MRLVERHLIKPSNLFYQEIDEAAFKSKNLYNRANYQIRQHFFETGQVLSYPKMDKLMQLEEAYQALPRKVSQQVLRLLDQAWKSWKAASESWQLNPAKFFGKPRIPGYKEKNKGRFALVYPEQAISRLFLKQGLIRPSGLNLEVSTAQSKVQEVRIIPKLDCYVLEVIYEKETVPQPLNYEAIASLDLGLNNLVAVTSNQKGFTPILVNGRPLKSINQYYNKKRSQLQSCLPPSQKTSRQLRKLTRQRNGKIEDYLHKVSRCLINSLVQEQLGTLVIGKNLGWKQEINLGQVNNQNFVTVPHHRLIEMLTYKAELVGIQVILTEESYTSASSFLDLDPIPTYGENTQDIRFSGRRIKRGLYKSLKTGLSLNSDVNGSFNILRKATSSMQTAEEVEGVVVRPVKVTIPIR